MLSAVNGTARLLRARAVGAFVSPHQAVRYRGILQSWRVVDLTAAVAERAARLRASLRLKPADAVQAASAFAITADGQVTHDRDFERDVERLAPGLRIIA